ncbi:hypothetical protein ACLMAJ_13015 [Nocardia sp. KC 131]|uniref:hypothetical protein n=1 Tax=Nocardia arseniciresistens TaxID=3392119 RepID=UPI00398E8269
MSANASPMPGEKDVHLSVFLHGVRMDFSACLTAALCFVEDHRSHHYIDAVNVIPGDTSGIPRLPNERLYLDP